MINCALIIYKVVPTRSDFPKDNPQFLFVFVLRFIIFLDKFCTKSPFIYAAVKSVQKLPTSVCPTTKFLNKQTADIFNGKYDQISIR